MTGKYIKACRIFQKYIEDQQLCVFTTSHVRKVEWI